jgi:hypothetical protein
MAQGRLLGISILGCLLIGSSLYQMCILLTAGYEYYAYLHQEYSPAMILMRYIFSWVIKLVGLACGMGILRRNEFFRKAAILNSAFIVATVNLKHTYAAYSLHTRHLDQVMVLPAGITFSSMTPVTLMIQKGIDIVFGLVLIFYLTRPKVKETFRSDIK